MPQPDGNSASSQRQIFQPGSSTPRIPDRFEPTPNPSPVNVESGICVHGSHSAAVAAAVSVLGCAVPVSVPEHPPTASTPHIRPTTIADCRRTSILRLPDRPSRSPAIPNQSHAAPDRSPHPGRSVVAPSLRHRRAENTRRSGRRDRSRHSTASSGLDAAKPCAVPSFSSPEDRPSDRLRSATGTACRNPERAHSRCCGSFWFDTGWSTGSGVPTMRSAHEGWDVR
ncbi:hypothetical protein FNL39_103489 [Nocardia caishijiensis]|uniref:Uncharacterized protein n=1 Tax=Nocardia caishijiensis TaxID=184756 RepID=A0ABQ6YP54_9NOCA|nr:hypothetical protein FNL39_103489 [Nocardia caishijiensis]